MNDLTIEYNEIAINTIPEIAKRIIQIDRLFEKSATEVFLFSNSKRSLYNENKNTINDAIQHIAFMIIFKSWLLVS